MSVGNFFFFLESNRNQPVLDPAPGAPLVRRVQPVDGAAPGRVPVVGHHVLLPAAGALHSAHAVHRPRPVEVRQSQVPTIVPPETSTFSIGQTSLLYQFWIHTELIDDLGPLEWILNTPSHHRVHHGKAMIMADFVYCNTLWLRFSGHLDRIRSVLHRQELRGRAHRVGPTVRYLRRRAPRSAHGLRPRRPSRIVQSLLPAGTPSMAVPYRIAFPSERVRVHIIRLFGARLRQVFYLGKVFQKAWATPGLFNKLRCLFYGPGWFPGTPRLGNYEDLPEVSSSFC